MEALLGKTLEELQAVAVEVGLPKFAGKQLAEWMYVRRATSFAEMTNISLRGRWALAERYTIGRHAPVAEAVSVDGTRKYLFQVGDQYIESVYIPEDDRATLCVSTEMGCKMGCRFCMTGTLGFHGQLPAAEILNQILYFQTRLPLTPSKRGDTDSLTPPPGCGVPASNAQWGAMEGLGEVLTNIVYMGEGEPMDNLDNVLRSLQVMTSSWGCGWAPKRITVSSVGLPQLKRYLDECECHLAISLHNPFARERSKIMPAEKLYPLSSVLALLKQYDWTHQRRVSFEYICWAGQNDTPKHAKELVRLLRGINCRVNLIRFHTGAGVSPETTHAVQPLDNAFNGQLTAINGEPQTTSDSENNAKRQRSAAETDMRQMEWLRDYLTDNGITTTIRRSRGEDILAACGMLVNALARK